MKKANLNLTIEYDPNQTTPEDVADALNNLLSVVMSTPGILESHGYPQIGDICTGETEMYRYLEPEEVFEMGDEAQGRGSDAWFEIEKHVGSCLQEMPQWRNARRQNLVIKDGGVQQRR